MQCVMGWKMNINRDILECKYAPEEKTGRTRKNINRDILECKLNCIELADFFKKYINRDILECKLISHLSEYPD